MRYRVIFWTFSFLSFIIWSNDTDRRTSIRAAGMDNTISEIAPGSSGEFNLNKSGTEIAKPAETEKCEDVTECFLVSEGLHEGSTPFTGYDKGANPSLLVVETWEKSSLIDDSSCNSALIKLDGEKIPGRGKIKVSDSKMLLPSHAIQRGR